MIEPAQSPAHARVLTALRNAAARTGSDFGYLLGTAMRESSLDADAKASTSSATGLFQFTDQTWLATVKAHGAEYGLGRYADMIHANGGRYTVDSAAAKQEILALRKDAQTAAFMAGEAAQDIRQSLEGSLCRPVTCGELYAAHFLGEAGARKLIALSEGNPAASAADAFPQAARANHRAFYHADGTPKSAREVYNWAVSLPNAPQGVGASVNPGTNVDADAPAGAGASVFANMDLGSADRSFDSDADADDDNARSVANRGYVPTQPGAYTSTSPLASILPQAPLLLMPGVLEILASLSPSMTNRDSES